MSVALSVYLYIMAFTPKGELSEMSRYQMNSMAECQSKTKEMKNNVKHSIIMCGYKNHERFVGGKWIQKSTTEK